MKPNPTFLDKLIGRLDRLDATSVQGYVLRLVREKGFLETVFNTIKEGVIVLDNANRIQFSNASARHLLGMPEECGGMRMGRFLREVDWGRVMNAEADEWRRMALQEIEVFYPEHRFITFYLVPYHADAEEPGGRKIPMAILILHDVTERHQDTQKTLESQKVQAVTMLAAGVAHEIGNPLNSLTIHLQLLQRNLARLGAPAARRLDSDLSESAELVEVALQEVNRLDAIVQHFLHAVRPVPPEMRQLDVHPVLTGVLEFLRREIEDRGVLVEVTWPENLPQVLGDAEQLRQAFYNIVKNAVQAMPDGGALRIAAAESSQFLELRFADSGKGITPQAFTHLMEPYFSTKEEGHGLGLLIVDRIVRSHGGELGIESVPGAGTVFTVRLPLRERRLRLLQAGPEKQEEKK